MGEHGVSADYVIAELINMGFEFSKAKDAVESVGPFLDAAVEVILSGLNESHISLQKNLDDDCSNIQKHPLEPFHTSRCLRQTTISDHLASSCNRKRSRSFNVPATFNCQAKTTVSDCGIYSNCAFESAHKLSEKDPHIMIDSIDLELTERDNEGLTVEDSEWEKKICTVLAKHFGFSSLKGFQREAICSWLAHRDCVVLAATGSGKSLCFQLPALLSGQVVVVISPLISLMRDQCLKLARHGISACFLGSGQPDGTIERKAMDGMYDLVYVCPETLLRLVDPLRSLAENRGIALFAIDEAHCISKWGHDFRPDYGCLSVLRENFKACSLKFLKFDIPLMALTATATTPVRQDIIQSLLMPNETKIILTSFFRPNLRFSVKHSRTSSTSSYHRDFSDLINAYTMSTVNVEQASTVPNNMVGVSVRFCNPAESGCITNDASSEGEGFEDQLSDSGTTEINSDDCDALVSSNRELTVDFLEEEIDDNKNFDDLDVSCAEFCVHSLDEEQGSSSGPPAGSEDELQGPTIIYVPTRKETTKIAEFFCTFGVKAAAYHAMLPKSHLRCVHEKFHHNNLDVVVATIAFGMGIDKANVRRIIHYGWPQSLEAYYQEAGRAGRDGRLSDCILYANLTRIPTLLPSRRNEEQTKHAYKMLSDCFRYGMNTASCRAKMLVNYFDEEFIHDKCHLCDICVNGPPELMNMEEEVKAFMQIIKAQFGKKYWSSGQPDFRMVLGQLRKKYQAFCSSDRLWWQGLSRILRDKGYIKESQGMVRVGIKYPELTQLGMEFLQSGGHQRFLAYPEADMLISRREQIPYSSFSEWGRGWADPEVRQQRLQRIRKGTKKRGKRRKRSAEMSTVRARISNKLAKHKNKT